MSSRVRVLARQLIAAAFIAAAIGLSSSTAAAGSGPSLTLSVTPQRSNPAHLVLTGQLQGAGTTAKQSIAFFVVSTEFGRPLNVSIGSATTGSDGKASMIYTPTWSGETEFVARLAGVPAKEAPTATTIYRVAAADAGPLDTGANPARPFLFMGEPFLGALLAIVGIVWLTLIVTLITVIRRLPQLANRTL